MEKILKSIADTTYEYELQHLLKNYRRDIEIPFYTNPFDFLIKTLKNAISALEKSKNLGLEPNEIYPTRYRVCAKLWDFLGAQRIASIKIKTDEQGTPTLGVTPMRMTKSGGRLYDVDEEFIPFDAKEFDASFIDYVESKKNEIDRQMRISKLKEKTLTL